MPDINLTEKDLSTFADQQFIQVMYNGNTNSLPKSDSTDLDFTVKFMVDETIYQIIYVGENQKVSAPINVPIKEGYEFKNWLLNYEAFDFSTVITSDITLTAKFEEAGGGVYTWNGVASGDDITVIQPGDPGMPVTFHKVSNDKYTRSDIVNQTVKITCIDSDDNITVLSGNNIVPSSDDPSYTFIMLPMPLLLFSGEADIGSMLEIEEEIYLNGTYMISTTDLGSVEPFTLYCKELRIEVPIEEVIWEDDVTFVEGEGFMTAIVSQIDELSINTTDTYTFTCGEQTINGKFDNSEGAYTLGEIDSFGIAYMPDYEGGTIQIIGTTEMFDTETTYHAKLVKSAAPVEDVIWEDSFEFEATEGAIGYEGEYIFPALDKINTTDFFTLAILELDKSITAKFEIQDEETNTYSIRDTDETIVMVIDPTNNYIIIMTDQGDTAGTYTVKLTKSEAPTPSEHTFEGTLTFVEPEEGSDYYQAILPNTVTLAPKNYTITIDEDTPITLIHSYNSEAQAHIYVDGNNKVMMASVLVEGQTYSTVGLDKSSYSATVHNIILDEASAPSETTIIPTSTYETEDTGYGDGYLEFTDMEPPVIDDTVFGEYINEVDAAVDGGTLENIKHTITVGTETLTNQMLKSDARLGITYFGNVSLYDESGEDTGEEWFLGVSSTLAFTTKTPTTINFGLSYKIVQ